MTSSPAVEGLPGDVSPAEVAAALGVLERLSTHTGLPSLFLQRGAHQPPLTGAFAGGVVVLGQDATLRVHRRGGRDALVWTVRSGAETMAHGDITEDFDVEVAWSSAKWDYVWGTVSDVVVEALSPDLRFSFADRVAASRKWQLERSRDQLAGDVDKARELVSSLLDARLRWAADTLPDPLVRAFAHTLVDQGFPGTTAELVVAATAAAS